MKNGKLGIWLTGLALAVGLASAGQAQAQVVSGEAALGEGRWAVRGGFYFGQDFLNRNSNRTSHLEGFEIGADIPLIRRIPHVGGLTLSPLITFGGTSRSGNDTDGNIYRVLLTLRRSFGGRDASGTATDGRGPYVALGLGYAATDARINEFPDTDGFAQQFLVGYEFPGFSGRGRSHAAPFVELSYHNGPLNQLRGFSFDAGVRF